MDQVHVVRHKVLVESQAVRRVAREMGIARNTVRKYLAQAEPVRVEKEPRAQPVRELMGTMVKAWMFVMRLMHSGRDFAWLYLRQDQPSFLDGHVRAFEHFGCVPQRIAYDNLKAAVAKILVGSERQLAGRFEALSSHYLFEPCGRPVRPAPIR